jgi:hypothetical protein
MHRRRAGVLVLVCFLLLAACGGGSSKGKSDQGSASTPKPDDFVAQVASYELVANHDQRFLAAIAGNGDGKVLSYGSVELQFFYLGTRDKPVDPPQPKSTAVATFLPVAGQPAPPVDAVGPKMVDPSAGVGVYAADPVSFDTPGFWGVTVKAKIDDGRTITANSPFEVLDAPRLPFPGQPAPHTDNPVAGAAGVDPAAIDSRATGGAAIPDTKLHRTSIAAALDAHKPLVVVVSTPVYCVSRFCGPITDSVARLADTYGDRVDFVHLEVWQNFDKKLVNPAAAEWIQPKSALGDTQEPWVFLVGRDGVITKRIDNVVSDAGLEEAVKQLAG